MRTKSIVLCFFAVLFFVVAASSGYAGTIVYDAKDSAGNWHIWAIKEDGTQKTQITYGTSNDQNPACSPDGEKIAFVSDLNGKGIYIMDKDGSNIEKIYAHIAPYGPSQPLFTSDGQSIFFYLGPRSGYGEIWTVSTDGNEVEQFTFFGENTNWLDISPDGQKMVFVQQPGGGGAAQRQELYVSNLDGTYVVRLTNDGIKDAYAKWSPDGQQIMYNKRPNVGNPL